MMNDNCVKVLLLNSNREDYSRYKRLLEGFFSWFKQVVIVADWSNELARKFAEENGYKIIIKKQNSHLSVPWEYYLVDLICSSDVVMMFPVKNTEFIRRVLELAEERNKPLVHIDKQDEAVPINVYEDIIKTPVAFLRVVLGQCVCGQEVMRGQNNNVCPKCGRNMIWDKVSYCKKMWFNEELFCDIDKIDV